MSEAWEQLKRQLNKIQGTAKSDLVLEDTYHERRADAFSRKREARQARIRQEKADARNKHLATGMIPRRETMELAINALKRQVLVARGEESIEAHRLLQTVRKVYARHYGC